MVEITYKKSKESMYEELISVLLNMFVETSIRYLILEIWSLVSLILTGLVKAPPEAIPKKTRSRRASRMSKSSKKPTSPKATQKQKTSRKKRRADKEVSHR